MCGRYSLGLRPSQVRAYLANEYMPAYEAPPDEGDGASRQSYNFAPGYNGIVYRADVPDWGAGPHSHDKHATETSEEPNAVDDDDETGEEESGNTNKETRYKLQSMRWGLIPFWTRRSPDYTSMLKTINCRADSLAASGGMWNAIKPRKRCIVICQGFYEWYKNPRNPKDKTPYFVKRKDGSLMCMAGLWDCVRYEKKSDGEDGSEGEKGEKVYSYTIITTDSNKQLSFLHDRMPVILNNGSEEIRTWLDPGRHEWNGELQKLLKPFEGELEYYAVSQEVGKVGKNSERFIVPVDSKENKANIANFFGSAKVSPKKSAVKKEFEGAEEDSNEKPVEKDKDEDRATVDHEGTEDNAPLPVPRSQGIKREAVDDVPDEEQPVQKAIKKEDSPTKKLASPVKTPMGRKTRSATSNGSGTSLAKDGKAKGSQKITSFFSK